MPCGAVARAKEIGVNFIWELQGDFHLARCEYRRIPLYFEGSCIFMQQKKWGTSKNHGVLIWQTGSFRFQPDVSLKCPCPASLRVRERMPCPQSRPVSAREARLPWRGGHSGHPASMAGRAPGHAEAAGRRMARALRHCRPPFVMTRNSFEGCRNRSRRTSATVMSGCRAQIHIPSDLATIIAAITFGSHRRVKASSW